MNTLKFIRRAAVVVLLFPSVCLGYNPGLSTVGRIESAFAELATKPDAIVYLEDQVQQNNPYAYFYLGVAFELGRGVAKNPDTALLYYRAAADKVKEAAFNAARMLYLSDRPDDALGFLVVAAGGEKTDGIERAMVLLGRIYEKGETSYGRNYIAAARWYEAAARRKDPLAVGKMGEFLLYGLGRPINIRDAKIYLERAADMWNADAQYLLGEIFAKGLVTPVNRTEAGKWFFIAASHSPDHKRRGQSYLVGLNEMEIDSAKRMADLWVSAHPKTPMVDYLAIIEKVR